MNSKALIQTSLSPEKKAQTTTSSQFGQATSDDERATTIDFLCETCNHIITAQQQYKGELAKCCYCGAFTTIPRTEFDPNTIINDFVIIRPLYSNSIVSVYKAYQISLDRPCTFKAIHNDNQEFVLNLQKEAALMSQLIHNNIIQCYATGQYNNYTYYVTEYIEGKSLEKLLTEQPTLPLNQALNIIIQATEALSFVWENNKLGHYNITPKTIIIDNNGSVKLNSFYLAKILDDNISPQTTANNKDNISDFAAPEHELNMPLNDRSDIYRLGVILYLMITGKMPYTALQRIDLLKKHQDHLPVSPKTYLPELPNDFIRVISRLIAFLPKDRYDNYPQMLKELMNLEAKYNTNTKEQIGKSTQKLAKIYLRNPATNLNIPTAINLDAKSQKERHSKKHKSKIILSLIITAATILITISFLYFLY